MLTNSQVRVLAILANLGRSLLPVPDSFWQVLQTVASLLSETIDVR